MEKKFVLTNTKYWENILELAAILMTVIILTIHINQWRYQIDLTENKQFTLSKATKQLLKNLDETLYIEVYLEGDLNSAFRRLQKNIRYKLESFKTFSTKYIDYQFINLDKNPPAKDRERLYQQIIKRGLQPTHLYDNQNGSKIQKTIFPGAIVSYKGQETAVLFLKGNKSVSPQEQINQSIEGIEYELAEAIYKLSVIEKKRIAIIQGHNELSKRDLKELVQHLNQFYFITFTNIDNTIFRYDAVLITQPKIAFTQIDKFWIDQYLMDEGKILFLLDNIHINIDSIAQTGVLGLPYDLNISDLFFKYGLSLKNNLLQDQQAGFIEIVTGNLGNRPNIRRIPWPYYIYLNNFGKHPITKNLNVIYSKFISSIDTVNSPHLKKTPLIFSSQYTRIKAMPNVITLNELKNELQPERYKYKHVPVAYLVEGQFKSALPAFYQPPNNIKRTVKQQSGDDAKIIVFADGDVVKNTIDKKTGKTLSIDIDYSRKQYISNKAFITNALTYLIDKDGIIVARQNEISLRPLDKFQINDNRLWWQILNIGLPILWVIGLGVGRFYWRKNRYG